MDLVGYSIRKPVSVTVGVILIVMFGLIGIGKLPVQLTPDVETPQVNISTLWPGASPYEIEKEIIEEQEKVLKSVRGLTLMESSSYNNYGEITLSFRVGEDLDTALLRVSNKLDEVPRYPVNAEKPFISATGGQSSPVIWMMLKTKSDDKAEINEYRTFFEDEVRQYIERVPGVGSLFVFGGSENQLEVVVDREKLARYQLTISDVVTSLTNANQNISAGVLGLDKSDYRVRTVSQFDSVSDPLTVVLKDDGYKTIRVKDVAGSVMGQAARDVSVMQNGDPVIVIGVRREKGENVIELTKNVKAAVAGLNEGILKDNGLRIEVVYDQTGYIENAIDIVKNNVYLGGALAIIILLLFLRSVTSTLTISLAIPISVIGSFIFLWLMDRNINVVTLAGISFAVGMLVDNSIVVIENIDRHRGLGKSAFKAAHDGAREVWGAVLASTATTVAVFLPVIFIEEEAGQLFRDIAIAITFAILLSLFVSVSVIPSLIKQFYGLSRKKKLAIGPLERLGSAMSGAIMRLSGMTLATTGRRLLTVGVLTAAATAIVFVMVPKAEYLPQGNRNLVINILIPPPGYSLDKREDIGEYIFKASKPYFDEDYKDGIPRIRHMFYVAADRITLFGAISEHETEAAKMMPFFNRLIYSIPGMFGISMQAGIFQDNIGRGRTVNVDVSGDNIDGIIGASRAMFGMIQGKIPGSQVRPVPSLETSYPEANIIPDRSRLAANGLTESELGQNVDVIMDGRKIGDYKPQGKNAVDLVVRARGELVRSPEDVTDSMISNRFGDVVRISDVARLEYSQGMPQINHLERKRNVTLEVTPPETVPLQEAMEIVENEVIAPLKASGALSGINVRLGGQADKLTQTRQALQWNFLLAVVITYLLLAALLESFFYPLIIMFTVPLAAAGGFLGLKLENLLVAPQPFDILTMLGFVMLIGMVVNNPILIVYQALNNVRHEGMDGVQAITESVRTRIRPIFMSASTSVLGFMPMVLSTGAGSELYRGIGSVILGGLALSTVFTVFLTPALLSFFIGMEKKKAEEQ